MTRAHIVFVLAMAGPAAAQPSGAQAETLFREAKELMAAGKFAEACAAFDASQKLDPTISTLINQANCREKNSQLATAWGLFLEAERQTRTATDDATKKLHTLALDRGNKLEKRVSKLTINVPDDSRIDRLEIRRDRELVDTIAWNRALPVDGGTYQISAKAPGTTDWSSAVTIAAEGDTKTIDIPKLQGPTAIKPIVVAPVRPPPPVVHDRQPSRSRIVPLAIGAGGLVALGGAVGFDLWGNQTYDQAKAEMTDNARRRSLESSANTKRYVAQGLAVAGLGCAGVAVWLYLRGGHDEPAPTTALVVTGDGLGIAGQF